MKYINTFKNHASYEEKLNGGVDISLPNVSYCEDVKDVHYNPYNLIEFYVGEITPPQTVSIYTDATNHLDVTVSEGNKWYSYLLPKDKGLYRISGNTVKKVVVKANITTSGKTIIPKSVVEASFKGSNTSKVTNMNDMFYFCTSLTSLDVSRFNTSNVTSMKSMFGGCKGLTSLDVSNFNTSNVTNMNHMFYGCSGLTSLDLSNFNTSKVTDMTYMFSGCTSLTSLDVSSFDTSNATHMGGMFYGCSGLTLLDLSGWDTSKVININEMFEGCTSLTTIKMIGCSGATRTKIEEELTAAGIKDNVTFITE